MVAWFVTVLVYKLVASNGWIVAGGILWSLLQTFGPTILDHLLQELREQRKKSGPTPRKGSRTPARKEGDE
jgi:hypothetical protein